MSNDHSYLEHLSEQKLISIISNSKSGLLFLDNKGLILSANKSVSNMTGFSQQKLVGSSVYNFINEFSRNTFSEFIDRIFFEKESDFCNVIFKTDNSLPLELIIEGIYLDQNECCIRMTDNSSNSVNLEKMKTEQNTYKSILDNLNEGVVFVDEYENVQYANKAGDIIFGLNPGELRNRNLKDFLGFEQSEILTKQTFRRKQGLKTQYELTICCNDGLEKTLQVSGTPYNDRQGNFIGTLGLFFDISIQKKYEKEFEHRHQLESIISKLSREFIHVKSAEIDDMVDLSLKVIGEFSGVDRSYIFLFDENKDFMSNSHEWCNLNINPQKESLQHLPVEMFSWWLENLQNNNLIHLPKVSDLPDEAYNERVVLEAQDIKSLLVIPLQSNDSLLGFIGFDVVKNYKNWSNNDQLLLNLYGEILVNAFKRISYEKELNLLNQNLEEKILNRTKELENINELNKNIIHAIRLIVITTDSSGYIKSLNPFAENSLGIKIKEREQDYNIINFINTDSQDLIVDEIVLKNSDKQHLEFKNFITDWNNKKNQNSHKEWQFKSISGEKLDVIITVEKLMNSRYSSGGYVIVAIDITDRKKAEALAKMKEIENQVIVQSVPDLIFKINKQGVLLDYLNNVNGILYEAPENFLGKNIREVTPYEIAANAMAALDTAFKDGKAIFEYQMDIDNNDYFFENRIVAISDKEAFSFVRDITERKKTDLELKNTTKNLSVLIENLDTGILFENKNRTVTLANQTFCDMFDLHYNSKSVSGFNSDEIFKNVSSIMPNPEEFLKRIKDILGDGTKVLNDELWLKNRKVIERDYTPVKSGNELIGHLWQYRDISERKKKEKYHVQQRDLGFSLAGLTLIDDAIELVLSTLLDIDTIDAAGIYLLEENNEILRLKSQKGLSEDFADAVNFYTKNHKNYQLVCDGEPFYNYFDTDTSKSPLFKKEKLKDVGIIPFRHENKVLGSINIGSRTSNQIKLDDRMAVELISSLLGDTVERIRIENELRLSQRNFNLMFDTLEDFMFILDKDGNIIKTNPVVSNRLGYTAEELKGLSVLQVHPAERRQEAAGIVEEMLQGKRVFCPIPLCTKEGKFIPVETKVVYGKWDENDALYGISRDITERLRKEEELRKSELRWRFALEGMGDGLWDWNIITNEVFYSSQWKKMLGYEDSEIENRFDAWINLIHPDDLKESKDAIERHIRGDNEIYLSEHRLLCKNGDYKWILDRGKIVEYSDDGIPTRMIGTHTDITIRKNFEVQLQKAIEREKELNELKSRFVSTTSHEFRTPLASILMVSDILINYQHKMNPESVSEKIKLIKMHAIQLTDIVNEVLQLSKIKEGRIVFNPQANDLVVLCKNSINSLKTTFQIENVLTFTSTFETLVINIDKFLITQAISNLISNALKYSGENPEVSIEIFEEDDNIILSVKDKGIGIPSDDQKHLFTPFFRAGNAKTIQGTGLGLSIVKETILMHGGNISYESNYGIGSTFKLHFPKKLLISFTI